MTGIAYKEWQIYAYCAKGAGVIPAPFVSSDLFETAKVTVWRHQEQQKNCFPARRLSGQHLFPAHAASVPVRE